MEKASVFFKRIMLGILLVLLGLTLCLAVREGLTTETGDIRLPAVLALEHWEYVLWRLLEGTPGDFGRAEYAAAALLEYEKHAGDDTVLIIARNEAIAGEIMEALTGL